MITDDAIKEAYKLLNAVTNDPVHKRSRPSEGTEKSYYVINSLPINRGVLQQCIINVNAYCEDAVPGVPDTETLATMTRLVISTLDEFVSTSKNIFFFFQQECTYEGEPLESHYSNMRFEIKLLNA